jgi:hypothetical protein
MVQIRFQCLNERDRDVEETNVRFKAVTMVKRKMRPLSWVELYLHIGSLSEAPLIQNIIAPGIPILFMVCGVWDSISEPRKW